MRKIDGKLIFSPSDLITFMDSKFDSWMDRFSAEYPGSVKHDEVDASHQLLQKLGNRHEDLFLEKLKADGLDVAEIPVASNAVSELATIQSMQEGRQVIYQGVLTSSNFAGRTDFLYRVDGASALGDYHYEVWDTKLAKKAKPYFVIQLCCYAEMMETIQQVMPESIRIVLGDSSLKSFATNDYIYFYRQLKAQFLEFHNKFSRDVPPEDCGPGKYSRWSTIGEKMLEDRDDLSRVANIRNAQIQRLKKAGICTMTALAQFEPTSIPKMSAETLRTLRNQATLQNKSRDTQETVYEFLPKSPGKGFALLPPTAVGDIYFDMEGYPHIDGGLEYLFGTTYLENGEARFKDWWAHDRAQEKVAFEQFIDWVYARWLADRSMHIYHYASYEVSAMRRLAGRHSTRIDIVDELLKNEVFVDLFQVVRQGLQVGEPSYSIKYIEHLYREKRTGSVAKATDSVVFYERWTEAPDGATWETSEILKFIRDYNEEDCVSTMQLTDWLRSVCPADVKYVKPTTAADNDDDDENRQNRPQKAPAVLAQELMEQSELVEDPQDKRVTQLLAGLLEFHTREQKPMWWRYFDRRKFSDEELCEDLDCLSSLRRTSLPPQGVRKSFAFEYEFDPDQDTKIEKGDRCMYLHDSKPTITIEEIDRRTGRLSFALGKNAPEPPAELCLVLNDFVSTKPIAESIFRTVSNWHEKGVLPPALRDFLYRHEPKITGKGVGEAVIRSSSLGDTIDAIQKMERTTLCIQGPPGCGKTYTASHTIVELLRQGKKVGITSNSHRVIEHLLETIVKDAKEQNVVVRGAKIAGPKPSDHTEYARFDVEYFENTGAFFKDDDVHFNLVGGTAWFFSDQRAAGTLDYIFVDEAGQVCVANVVAISPSASNMVLIGDQMQLEQPIQGAHPGETGQSSLDYFLQEHATIPRHFGIFLGTTRRMHPSLCQIISSAVYESRLVSDLDNEKQILVAGPLAKERLAKNAGLIWLPVQHQGNSQSSEEEVEVIARLVDELLKWKFVDKKGEENYITLSKDILIVAPYNMQVRLLSDQIRGVQVASVDKFQGREAPIVILSMCASEGTSSPRGMEFLLSKSRLNVAISRAKTMAFVVGNPELLKTNCSTLEQMHLLNFLCQISEAGKTPQITTSPSDRESLRPVVR